MNTVVRHSRKRIVPPIAILLFLVACSPYPASLPEVSPVTETPPPVQPITASPPPKGPIFHTANFTITPKIQESGSPVAFQVIVTNTGDEAGSTNISLKIEGNIVDTKTVNLAPGNSQSVSFSRLEYSTRTYAAAVDNLTGTFTIRWTPPPTPAAIPPSPVVPAVKDVPWSELRSFLMSANATAPLATSAKNASIKVGRAVLSFRDSSRRTLNVFNTTDYGLVYVSDSKAEGSYLIWSIDIKTYFFLGLPLTQFDINYYHDQAWWEGRTSMYGIQITLPTTGQKIWDYPLEVNITW